MLIALWEGDELSIMEHTTLSDVQTLFMENSDGLEVTKNDYFDEIIDSAKYLYYEEIPRVKDKYDYAEELMCLWGKTKYKVVIFYET